MPFLILVPSTIAMSINRVALISLSGLGKPTFQSISAFFILIFSFIFSIIFIPKYGIVGASISKSITYFLSLFFS